MRTQLRRHRLRERQRNARMVLEGIPTGHLRDHWRVGRQWVLLDEERAMADPAGRAIERVKIASPGPAGPARPVAARMPSIWQGSIAWFFGENASMHGGMTTARLSSSPSQMYWDRENTCACAAACRRKKKLPRPPAVLVGDVSPHMAIPDDGRPELSQVWGQSDDLRVVEHDYVTRPDLFGQRDQLLRQDLLIEIGVGCVEFATVALHAVEQMVDALGQDEKVIRALDDQPSGADPDAQQVAQNRTQELGHAAPGHGGVHVDECPALHGGRTVTKRAVKTTPPFRAEDGFEARRIQPGSSASITDSPNPKGELLMGALDASHRTLSLSMKMDERWSGCTHCDAFVTRAAYTRDLVLNAKGCVCLRRLVSRFVRIACFAVCHTGMKIAT